MDQESRQDYCNYWSGAQNISIKMLTGWILSFLSGVTDADKYASNVTWPFVQNDFVQNDSPTTRVGVYRLILHLLLQVFVQDASPLTQLSARTAWESIGRWSMCLGHWTHVGHPEEVSGPQLWLKSGYCGHLVNESVNGRLVFPSVCKFSFSNTNKYFLKKLFSCNNVRYFLGLLFLLFFAAFCWSNG